MTPEKKKESFIRTLLNRRARISAAIRTEEQKSMPDSLRLSRMKKLRLALKDQLYALRGNAKTVGLRQWRQTTA